MEQKAYVICADWGEYDDYTQIPMFVCYMQMEAELFVEALCKQEQPYWEKIEDYFLWSRYGIHIADLVNVKDQEAADMRKYCIPHDIGFSYKELDVLTLIQHRQNT